MKRSAEADSVSAEEWSTPSNHHDSKVKDHLANEQPTLKPVATTKVNQSMTTTESNKDQPLSATSVDQQVSPTGCESQVCTRSGRLVKPPSCYTDLVTLKV